MKNRIWSLLDKWGIAMPPAEELPRWSRRFIDYLEKLDMGQPMATRCLHQYLAGLKSIRLQIAEAERTLSQQCKASGIWGVIEALQSRFGGVGRVVATGFCCEIMDTHRFGNADKLSSYLGLAPDVHSSSDSEQIKGVSSRCNQRLRRVLIEAAWVAIRKDEELHRYWRELKGRMAENKAILRVAKKLALQMRRVWLDYQWQPTQASPGK